MIERRYFEMDRYSKFILTVIAILLALHLVKPWLTPKSAEGVGKVVDVNIAQVGGFGVYSQGIPVVVQK